MPRLNKAEQERKDKEREAACDRLRELFPVGSHINIVCTEVSRSGSTNGYRVLISNHPDDERLGDISWLVATAIDAKRSNSGAIKSGGWGLDRAFHIVYRLGRALYPHGVPCTGDENCRSNDHFNGDHDFTKGKIHSDGGYAYRMHRL